MNETQWSAAYLGGYPRFPVLREPTTGALRITSDTFQFLVMGEYFDTLFEIPFDTVTSWDVEGTNMSTRQTSGGRAAVGALLAGAAGAIVGLAATKEGFSAVLAIATTYGSTIGFLIRDLPPTAVVAELRRVDVVGELYQAVGAPRQAWDYETAALVEVQKFGDEGWEAAGVWVDTDGEPRVLLKRPRL